MKTKGFMEKNELPRGFEEIRNLSLIEAPKFLIYQEEKPEYGS